MKRMLLLGILLLAACQKSPEHPVPAPVPTAPGVVPASTDVGSGGENFAESAGAAWFLGAKREVPYCIIQDPAFGIAPEKAREEIAAAFKTWRRYVTTHHIHWDLEPEDRPATQFVWVPECGDDVPLVIELGTGEGRAAKDRARFANPTAFAMRTFFDPATRKARGYLWFARRGDVLPPKDGTVYPEWNRPGVLRAMALHEIGHVLGNSHIRGTVMSPAVTRWIADPKLAATLALIDQQRELALCPDCRMEYTGTLPWIEQLTEQHQLFRDLLGRRPKDDVTLFLSRAGAGDWTSFVIVENATAHPIRIVSSRQRVTATRGGEVFKVVLADGTTRALPELFTVDVLRLRPLYGTDVSLLIQTNAADESDQPGGHILLSGERRLIPDPRKWWWPVTGNVKLSPVLVPLP